MTTAAAMTFNSLVSDIELYTEKTADPDFIAQIPRIIMLAEFRIATEVRSLGLLTSVTSNFVTSAPGTSLGSVVAKPVDWRETVSINYGAGTGNNTRNFVFERTLEYLRTYWPDPTQTSAPKYWADYDWKHVLVAPTPDQAYPFEWVYYQRPIPLDTAHQTNWLTDFAPQLLLYACLLESNAFLKNFDGMKLATWEKMYAQAATSIDGEMRRQTVDRSTLVDKPSATSAQGQ